MNISNARRSAAIGIVIFSFFFMACSDKQSSFSFKTADEAITACSKELNKLKTKSTASIDELGKMVSTWLVLQDSSVNVIIRDTMVVADDESYNEYFMVADSIRKELARLALSQKRSMEDVVQLKLVTAKHKETVDVSHVKMATAFYEKLDNTPLYTSLQETMKEYDWLLDNTEPFRKEGQMLAFIKREDRCFHSLMNFLHDTPEEYLQTVADKTSDYFDELYRQSEATADDEVSERVLVFLTMRFNRRIIQNAEACRRDVKIGKYLDTQQQAAYRWMLIQPLMTIDSYGMALLTDKQQEQMVAIAKELPALLAYIDNKDYDNSPKEETQKLSDVLCEYFVKSYLNSIL